MGKPGSGAVNSKVVVDQGGKPWIFFRYCPERGAGYWQLAFTRFDGKEWSQAKTLANSAFCQDRRCSALVDEDGMIWAAWPRTTAATNTAIPASISQRSIRPRNYSAGPLPFEIEGIRELSSKLQRHPGTGSQ